MSPNKRFVRPVHPKLREWGMDSEGKDAAYSKGQAPPNMRFQPTASLACARFAAAEARAVRRLSSGMSKSK